MILSLSYSSTLVLFFFFLLQQHSFFFVRPAAASYSHRRRGGHPQSRSVTVTNNAGSGVRIDFFWIHIETRELAPSNTDGEGIVYGSETHISSYVGHEFEVQELPNKKTGKCRNGQPCKKAYFQVNANEEQRFTVNEDFSIVMEDNRSRALEQAKRYLKECRAMVEESTSTSATGGEDKIEQLAACVKQHAERAIAETQQDIDFEATVRTDIAKRLVPYACHPRANMTTSKAIENTTITVGRSSHLVEILFQSHGSEILLVHNVMTESQCQAMQQRATIVMPTTTPPENDNDSTTDASSMVHKRQLPATPAVLQDSVVRTVVDKLESLLLQTTRNRISYRDNNNNNMPGGGGGALMQLHVYGNNSTTGSTDDKDDNSFVAQGCVMNDDGTCADGGNFGTRVTATATTSTALPHRIVRPYDDIKKNALLDYVIICSVPDAGGAIHFPKAGVHIQPTSSSTSTSSMVGNMILIRYERDRRREMHPIHMLVNEYLVCPVTKGQLVTLTDGV